MVPSKNRFFAGFPLQTVCIHFFHGINPFLVSKLILDSVEEYAGRWAKKEDVEVNTLSEWVNSVMSLVNRRASVLSRTMSRRMLLLS